MIEFALPSLGSDMEQGKLLQWKVAPGQPVRRGDIVAVVDTSKAAVDVESWQEGTMFELLVTPGETVPVGTVLATFLEPGESPETAERRGRATPQEAAAPVAAALTGTPAPAATPREAGAGARPRSSPAARRRAEELGLALDAVPGTGQDGAITLDDVERAAAGLTAQPAADKRAEMRKAIGAAMSRSKREIPHYYLSEAIPMRAAQDWLSAANARRDMSGRLLMAVLQLKAVALALQAFPDLNGSYRDGRFTRAPSAHIGVAISLREGGLIAPAIHDAGTKSVDQLMRELTDLVARARSGSLRSSEMSDPTVTVTNLGEQGVDSVFGVIYPPQVALVGFGRISERPWAQDNQVLAMPVTIASLSGDHRVSDGHYGALFLAELGELLQHPDQLGGI